MSTVTQPAISLTVDAVAAELNASPVEIKRLISKRLLPAAKVGNEFRVLPGDVANYIGAGAKNLRLSEFKEPASWFDSMEADELRRVAESFSTAVLDAAREQIKPEADVRQAFEREPLRKTGAFAIEVRGKVAEVLGRSVPTSPFATNDPKAGSRFPDWKSAWAVYLVRRVAKEIVGRMNRAPESPISVLYSDAETFTKIVDEAYETAAQRIVTSFSVFHSFSGGVFGSLPVERRSDYSLAASAILTPSARAGILASAF